MRRVGEATDPADRGAPVPATGESEGGGEGPLGTALADPPPPQAGPRRSRSLLDRVRARATPGSFLRHMLTVMTGTTVAQGLAVGTAPLLTRI